MGKRAPGKKLLGAQASPALWDGINRWLEANPDKTISDFVVRASVEKLKAENIAVDEVEALRRNNRRGKAATFSAQPEKVSSEGEKLKKVAEFGMDMMGGLMKGRPVSTGYPSHVSSASALNDAPAKRRKQHGKSKP